MPGVKILQITELLKRCKEMFEIKTSLEQVPIQGGYHDNQLC